MDHFDKKILKLLQEDVTISTAALSEKVGLSTTPCWRRIQILEEKGYIEKRVALVNKKKVNLGLSVIVNIKTTQHSKDWLDNFKNSCFDIFFSGRYAFVNIDIFTILFASSERLIFINLEKIFFN